MRSQLRFTPPDMPLAPRRAKTTEPVAFFGIAFRINT
jgi:hypothetical protein